MNDTNNVTIIGRLTRDSELTYTNTGTPICKFSIAFSSYAGKDKDNYTSFIAIVLWGKQGESISQYLLKGKQICVTGELRQDRWQQEGQNRSKVEIVASNVQLLGDRSQGSPRQEFDRVINNEVKSLRNDIPF